MADDTRPHPRGVTGDEDLVLPAPEPTPACDDDGGPPGLDRKRVPLDVWGDFLRYARHHRGLSQEALAVAAGTSQQTVSKIESGDLCPHDKLKARLAEALDVPAGVLFPWPPRLSPAPERPAPGGSEDGHG